MLSSGRANEQRFMCLQAVCLHRISSVSVWFRINDLPHWSLLIFNLGRRQISRGEMEIISPTANGGGLKYIWILSVNCVRERLQLQEVRWQESESIPETFICIYPSGQLSRLTNVSAGGREVEPRGICKEIHENRTFCYVLTWVNKKETRKEKNKALRVCAPWQNSNQFYK